jgi:hypothetical protein
MYCRRGVTELGRPAQALLHSERQEVRRLLVRRRPQCRVHGRDGWCRARDAVAQDVLIAVAAGLPHAYGRDSASPCSLRHRHRHQLVGQLLDACRLQCTDAVERSARSRFQHGDPPTPLHVERAVVQREGLLAGPSPAAGPQLEPCEPARDAGRLQLSTAHHAGLVRPDPRGGGACGCGSEVDRHAGSPRCPRLNRKRRKRPCGRRGAQRPALRPPPPRTPKDARRAAPSTSCVPVTCTAYAEGRTAHNPPQRPAPRPPPPRTP